MNIPATDIVILNDHASLSGGASAVAIAAALGLAARGLRVDYFACIGPVAAELRDVPNLTVHCLDQTELVKSPHRLHAAGRGLKNTAAERELRRLLQGRDPARTIVHVHSWMKALSPFVLHTVSVLGFRLVVTLHDFFIACPNGGFFEYGSGVICHRQPLSMACVACRCDRRSQLQKLWRCARTVLQNRVLGIPGRVDHYIGVSDFSLKLLRPHLPAGVPVSVLQNPVHAINAVPVPVEHNKKFVFIGRFVPEKGVRLFAEAVRATGQAAIFVGDGELRGELRERCPKARFTGWLTPERIRVELRHARALVFPSLWYETLGLVTVEAAAAGVPAIVSDQCAATDWVHHGENGLHFKHGSSASLAVWMQTLAANDLLAARLGRFAYRRYWQAPWTIAGHIDGLLDIYATLPRREVAA